MADAATSLFHRLFPFWTAEGEQGQAKTRPYSRLWWYTVLLTSAVALLPLIIITTISYYQYRNAFVQEMIGPAQHLTASVKRTTEFFLEERRAAMRFLVRDRSFEELADQDKLRRIFSSMKEAFGGFVDVGLIDSGGVQRSYAGPYELTGVNYRHEDWFHAVRLRHEYLSDVFMGHRHFPHFVIAIKHERDDGSFYVLRATLDMGVVQEQLETLELQPTTDAFLMNRDGTLQTESRFGGKVLQKSYAAVPPFADGARTSQEVDERGRSFIRGYAYIDKSPFIFMLIQRTNVSMQGWVTLRNRLLAFLGGSTIVILVLVIGTSSYMVRTLVESDRKQAEAMHHLEYSNKLATIGRLGAGVAHEINNPLAIINEKSGLLRDLISADQQHPNREKYLKILDAVLYSVERCSRITHRLLGFAKRIDVQRETIDVFNLINEVLGFLSKEAEHRNISVSVSADQGIPTIESDRGQLEQVFLNIVNNAFAALESGGRIMITLREITGNRLEVTISDNGPGIPKEVLPRIFEPFFSTKGEGGTGLGLSITYGIVQKLGGELAVQSDVGHGTSFTITLPVEAP
jgi:two-component system NtrC family sensor kinase